VKTFATVNEEVITHEQTATTRSTTARVMITLQDEEGNLYHVNKVVRFGLKKQPKAVAA